MEEINSLDDLLDLQAVDFEIDRLLHRRETLPALAAYQAAHDTVGGLVSRIDEASARRAELDRAEDKAEGEMGLDEEKLEREERRLYAGGLSARDAGHLRDEVEMLRARVSKREDEALALIEQREEVQKELDELERQRADAAGEESRLEEEIRVEWAAIDADVARLKEKKAGIVPSIDPELLALYEEIRPTMEGVSVAPMVDGVCGGCHLRLSAAEESQALKSVPPRCLHCRRILVPR